MADDDEMRSYVDAFVKKDMKDHPDCRYSLSSQKECSSNNGSFACETIRRVFRNCPGLRPEQVYDITTRDTGNIPKSPGESGGGGGTGGGVSVPGTRAPQQPRGGSPAFGPQDIWPPGRSGMDDLLGNLHDRLNNFFKESPFAGLDADINPFGGGGGGGGVGGGSGGGGGGGSVSVGDQSGGAEFPPRVPPPHKRRQSDPAKEEQGAGEAAKGGSSVAKA
ncbi:unnamed protein product [Ectocarpus sp. 12 AP-2014]